MRHNLTYLVLFSFFIACVNRSNFHDKASKNDVNGQNLKKVMLNNDTLIVTTKAAIFVSADSIKIEKAEKRQGESFYIAADDAMFYVSNSQNFLDSVKLKTFNIKNEKFIKFISDNKTQHIINIDTLSRLWNIYFFDPAKKPKLIDMTATDDEYKSYFK